MANAVHRKTACSSGRILKNCPENSLATRGSGSSAAITVSASVDGEGNGCLGSGGVAGRDSGRVDSVECDGVSVLGRYQRAGCHLARGTTRREQKKAAP
jgi:hypothetical protein